MNDSPVDHRLWPKFQALGSERQPDVLPQKKQLPVPSGSCFPSANNRWAALGSYFPEWTKTGGNKNNTWLAQRLNAFDIAQIFAAEVVQFLPQFYFVKSLWEIL